MYSFHVIFILFFFYWKSAAVEKLNFVCFHINYSIKFHPLCNYQFSLSLMEARKHWIDSQAQRQNERCNTHKNAFSWWQPARNVLNSPPFGLCSPTKTCLAVAIWTALRLSFVHLQSNRHLYFLSLSLVHFFSFSRQLYFSLFFRGCFVCDSTAQTNLARHITVFRTIMFCAIKDSVCSSRTQTVVLSLLLLPVYVTNITCSAYMYGCTVRCTHVYMCVYVCC